MYNFEHSYKCFTMEQDERLNITQVCAKGTTMGEMLSNIEVYAEDWHGNPVDMPFESLSVKDSVIIRADIAHFLHCVAAGPKLGNGGEPVISYPEGNND